MRDVGFGVAIVVDFSLYRPGEYFVAPTLHPHAIFNKAGK